MDNQVNTLIWHFENVNDTITFLEALNLYAIGRLADVVYKAKKRGYNISTIMTDGCNRFGKPVRYATYKYNGKVKS